MKIILEGPDCSGKTTLSKLLPGANASRHFGPPDNEKIPYAERLSRIAAWEEYLKFIWEMDNNDEHSESGDIDRVIDRFCYGEYVYGPIYRDDHRYRLAHIRMLERVLMTFPTFVVWCQSNWPITLELWRERREKEMVKEEEKFRKIYLRFSELFQHVGLPKMRYDFTQDTDKDVRAAIREAESDPSMFYRNRGPGIGNFQPGVTLLVGDRINENVSNYEWPFVAQGGSSLWLAEQLIEWGVPEHHLYWINSTSISGHPTPLGKWFEDLHPKQVIALGTAASIWCKQNRIKHHTVAHPAYHKRFQSGKEYPLKELLCPSGSTASTPSTEEPSETF